MFKKIIITAVATVLWTNASALSSRRSNSPGSNPEYWWLCPVDRSLPGRPEYSATDELATNTEIRAGQSRVPERDITDFEDNVELVKGDLALRAAHVAYSAESEQVRAFGDVHLWNTGMLWRGQRAVFNLADEKYRLEGGIYWLLGSPGRGFARSVTNDSRAQMSIMTHVDYSTCPVNNEAWKFSATRIRLDHDVERGYATNALLKVRGVPVFYFPYASFPLTGKRKSGLLIPTIGSSSTQGFDARIPYYINIAPNQDATVTPRWISRRGLMMDGEYRYLNEGIKTNLNFSYLPSDRLAQDSDRSSVRLRHEQYFDDRRGKIYTLFQNVSDAQYFEDFGGSLSVSSQRFLDRRLESFYRGRLLYFHGLVQSFQSVDDSLPGASQPYRRLPQLELITRFPIQHLRPHAQLISDFTYFSRDDSVSGGRIALDPTLSLPFVKPWLFARPAIGLRTANYFLNGEDGYATDPSRVAPIFSTDIQFFAERRFAIAESRFLQTLEPRAFYLLVPKVNQEDLPIFDSGLTEISFANLFRENRFAGHDRIGDANQLALALTSRLLSLANGRELLRTSFGQIRYFTPRTVTIRNAPEDYAESSELVAEVASNPTTDWSTRFTFQWDPDTDETQKSAVALRYAPSDGTIINAAYRLRGNISRVVVNNGVISRPQDVEQTDVSFRVPLTENLNVIGRWNYSLQGEESLELVGGIELETCCWGFRLFSRRYIRNVEGQFDNAIFMQAEFKGLGGLGNSASSFLKRNIPGYEPLF